MVVNISTTQTVDNEENPLGELFSFKFPKGSPFNDLPDLFERFYGQRGGNGGNGGKQETTSLGSGFVISADGHIVTNNHVIDGADEIEVIFNDDTKLKAEIIGTDSKTDIAVLKVETKKKLPAIMWGDSDKTRVGDWVIAIGNPFGLGGSVSAGIISARARDINAGPFDDFLQTDAAINRGNSGGPLFNVNGEVVGINTAIFSPSGGNVGIGFALPSELAKPIINQLQETGKVQRGWLGVKIQTVTEEIAESIGLDKAKGALVLDVTKDSPADRAGILPGDVILTFDGREVIEMRKLPRIVAESGIGDKIAVTVWRKEEEKALIVTVAELKDSAKKGKQDGNGAKKKKSLSHSGVEFLGITVSQLNADLRRRFSIDDSVAGLVVTNVDNKSAAYEKGIGVGDVIQRVNQIEVSTQEQVLAEIDKAKSAGRKSVLFLVSRKGRTLFVAIPRDKD
jgi:serine protease Do